MLQGLSTQICTSRSIYSCASRTARRIGLALLIALASSSPIPLSAQSPDPATPAEAVARYLDALLLGEGDAGALLCQANRAARSGAGPGTLVAARDILGIKADTSDLTIETTQQAATWANVTVTGRVVFAVNGLDAPLAIPIQALDLDTFWPVLEGGVWRACSAPPIEARDELGPDVIARAFVAAAYAGHHDDASALLCEAQRGQFSRARYDATFGSLFEHGVEVNLDTALFEIVEQDEAEAIVALEGQIALSWTGHGQSIVIDAAHLGFGPVRLINQDGWKICPESPVES